MLYVPYVFQMPVHFSKNKMKVFGASLTIYICIPELSGAVAEMVSETRHPICQDTHHSFLATLPQELSSVWIRELRNYVQIT